MRASTLAINSGQQRADSAELSSHPTFTFNCSLHGVEPSFLLTIPKMLSCLATLYILLTIFGAANAAPAPARRESVSSLYASQRLSLLPQQHRALVAQIITAQVRSINLMHARGRRRTSCTLPQRRSPSSRVTAGHAAGQAARTTASCP